jgi:glycosyltransferase involved in cell wall biosynthesis
VKLAVWSPLPPSSSGVADYAAEQLPALAERFEVAAVVEQPSAVDRARLPGIRVVSAADAGAADLDLYQLGNSAPHAFVLRAALARPGVVLLHDFGLHDLVLGETVERGDRAAYLREMRRAHGERGTFVGRQVARGLGGRLLPALFPLSDRVLERSLAVVGLTRQIVSRAAPLLPGRPALHLPHHVWLPFPVPPSREEARRALGLPLDAPIVTAPGLATGSKRLDVVLRVAARLRDRFPALRLVVAGDHDPAVPLADWARQSGIGDALVVTGRLDLPDFVRHLAAADVVVALRFPSQGEMSGAVVRALAVGRPTLVTSGTPSAEEFPEGCVVPVDPDAAEAPQLEALLGRLLGDPGLRGTIGRLAREHVSRHHALEATITRLAGFLADVAARKEAVVAEIERRHVPDGTLHAFLRDEARWAARDLGLPDLPPEIEPLIGELGGSRSGS